MLQSVPTYTIRKLQLVQNNTARIVLQAPRRSHATPLLNTLHWLPDQQRIDYKVALLMFKVGSTLTLSQGCSQDVKSQDRDETETRPVSYTHLTLPTKRIV